MSRFKKLLVEIHQRSVWQALAVYLGASYAVLEAAAYFRDEFGLPDWLPTVALVLLLIGLPVVVVTSLARGEVYGDEVAVPDAAAAAAEDRRLRLLTWRTSGLSFLGALALWGIIAAGLLLTGTYERVAADEGSAIAVLPFEDLSGDGANEAFTNGFHDVVLTHLYKIGGLRPISRTSVMEYRGSSKSIHQIADELGVTTVMEGAVQRAADRILVSVQLTDAATAEHIWAESYDRALTLETIFQIQQEIAQQIAAELRVTLSPDEERRLVERPTAVPAAYERYLTGAEYLRRGGVRDLEIAVESLEGATVLDSGFALAYAGLSEAHYGLWAKANPWLRTSERLERAVVAAQRALALDPELPEAHLAAGQCYTASPADFDQALYHFRIAVDLQPNDGTALYRLGILERRRGNFAAGVSNLERAVKLAPREGEVLFRLAHAYLYVGRYSDAERLLDRAIALEPDNGSHHVWKAYTKLNRPGGAEDALATMMERGRTYGHRYAGADRFRARVLLRSLPEVYQDGLREKSLEASGLHAVDYYLGQAIAHELVNDLHRSRAFYDSSRIVLEEIVEREPDDPFNHANLGMAYAGLGRAEDAVREGRRAVELRPLTDDAVWGIYQLASLAEIHAMVGNHDAAIHELERLLSVCGFISPQQLGVDALWISLRDHPRFQALLAKHDGPSE